MIAAIPRSSRALARLSLPAAVTAKKPPKITIATLM
jgi:hypothetical protein